MSTIIQAACWLLQLPPTAKFVLILLADNANDQGVCWPSIPKICERTCFSERTVHGAIKWLEQRDYCVRIDLMAVIPATSSRRKNTVNPRRSCGLTIKNRHQTHQRNHQRARARVAPRFVR